MGTKYDNMLAKRLFNCEFGKLHLGFPVHSLDVLSFVFLLSEPSEFTIRLVGGSQPWEGRVELLFQGEWGTICSSYWGKPDGDVACRMLGFSSAYEAISPTGAIPPMPFGEGTGTILLSDFRCTGTEENLADCSHSGWGDHNCYHYQDAGLVCNNPGIIFLLLHLSSSSPFFSFFFAFLLLLICILLICCFLILFLFLNHLHYFFFSCPSSFFSLLLYILSFYFLVLFFS